MNILNILLPELFLSISIFSLLMIGVFLKNSFNLIFKLSLLTLILLSLILINSDILSVKIFKESFIADSFSKFIKLMILISCIFILNSSQLFIKENKINFLSIL